jgi:hypothetical protein
MPVPDDFDPTHAPDLPATTPPPDARLRELANAGRDARRQRITQGCAREGRVTRARP